MKWRAKLRVVLASLLVGASLTGCSNTATFDNQLKEICKGIISTDGDVKYKKVMTSEAFGELTGELGYMLGSQNVYVDVRYTPSHLNSLGKDYYDITATGLNDGKHCKAELFLFTDADGKIIDVGAWLKTVK